MQQCVRCDADFADGLEQCPECGAPAPESGVYGGEPGGEVYVCARCEEEFTGSDACPACGALREEVACDRHPDREAVGRCVVCGRAVCDECGTDDGRAVRCADHGGVRVIEGWAQVYSATNDVEAQLLRDNLRAEGIDAQIFSQRDRAFSVDLGELSIVRLLVPVWDFERGLNVIREHMDTAGEVVFACPACGEAFDPGAEVCSRCGTALA